MIAPHRERSEGGQALVEFALVLPVFLVIVLGILDLGRAVWQENTLAYAAREGTRYAIVNGSGSATPVWPGNPGPVQAKVRAAAIGVPNVAVDVRWPDTVAGTPCYDRSCRVTVEASTAFVPLASRYFLGGSLQVTLRGGSTLVIQR